MPIKPGRRQRGGFLSVAGGDPNHARSESGAVSAGADSWKCQGTHSNEMARDTVIIEKRWR